MRLRYSFSSKQTGKFKKSPFSNQHKVAFPKMVMNLIRTCDVVLEVVDSRFIDKTRNKELEEEVRRQGKKLIFVLNKADIGDIKDIKMNYPLSEITPYVLFSSKSHIGRSRLRQLIQIEAKRAKKVPARVGIIGYPNTGKSTLINVLSGGKKAATSSQAGFTKALQKIKFAKGIFIIDSPGVIPPNEENSLAAGIVKKQSETSVTNTEKIKYPDFVVREIMRDNTALIDRYYGVDTQGDVEILLEILGKRWHFLKRGGVSDIDRTARKVLKEWKEGKIK